MTELDKLQLRVERAKRRIKEHQFRLLRETAKMAAMGMTVTFDNEQHLLAEILNILEGNDV